MCMNIENDNCRNECRDCVYYFEETDFCLKAMYSAKNTNGLCADWRSKNDYSPDTLVSNEDLEFSEELTDWRDEDITIAELFEELKAINEEMIE